MKRGLSLLVAMLAGATLVQASAQAAPLSAKPGIQSTVVKTTFFVDRNKAKHVRAVRKHRHHAHKYKHKHAHLKKASRKHHDKH